MLHEKTIKVLVVDDSASIRALIGEMLHDQSGFEMLPMAKDPFEAVEYISQTIPDVIILDLDLPKMNGLDFLKRLMRQHPIPVVVFSSHAGPESVNSLRAMELGAKSVLCKSKIKRDEDRQEMQEKLISHLIEAVKVDSSANLTSKEAEKEYKPYLKSGEMSSPSQDKIRVLIVDDSKTVRQALQDIFEEEDDLEVMGVAENPYVAVELIGIESPDVIVLDIEMPRMDGLTFLRKLHQQHTIPVIICSSLVEDNSEKAMEAYEAGAIEVVFKPKLDARGYLQESRIRICDAIRAAFHSSDSQKNGNMIKNQKILDNSVDIVLPLPIPDKIESKPPNVGKALPLVAVGSSTGGVDALQILLTKMPVDICPIVIVQHMPEKFTAQFARRINDLCSITVKEAEDGEKIRSGHAYIAPGNQHMMVKKKDHHYSVRLVSGEFVNRHRPSVDVLFRSVALETGCLAVGAILTGMGVDGALGLKEMRTNGAKTVAEAEKTCVVYGMPRAAVQAGAVLKELPIEKISEQILTWIDELKTQN